MQKEPYEEALERHYRKIDTVEIPSLAVPIQARRRQAPLWIAIAGPCLAGWAAALLLAYLGTASPPSSPSAPNPLLKQQLAQFQLNDIRPAGGQP